jgi:hypothetical protein
MSKLIHQSADGIATVGTASADQGRNLILHYRESEWRSTRLEVLKNLGRFQDARTLQFLIEIAEKNEDLAEQQLAILALSQRRSKPAQVFLRQFYRIAADTLKPAIAYAIGQAQDFTAIPTLLKNWEEAAARQDWLWLRNLVLALGELKAYEALPKLRQLLESQINEDSELAYAVLFAAARIERDASFLQRLEGRYLGNSLLHQVFQSTLSQVQIRSQFKLEDYLDKIFTAPEPHAILPLELKAFDQSEVALGLSIFSLDTEWRRFLFALRGLPSLKRVPYLKQIVEKLQSDEDRLAYLEAIPYLLDEQNSGEILKINEALVKTASLDLKLKYLESAAEFLELSQFAKEFFAQDAHAIRFLNLWSEWALVKRDGSQQKLAAVVTDWLTGKGWGAPLSLTVKARIMRAVAELKIEVKAIADQFSADFKEPSLRSSILLYLEQFPKLLEAKILFKEILALTTAEKENLGIRILAVLEAYAAQNLLAGVSDAQIHDLLKIYAEHFNLELQAGVLKFLRLKPLENWEAYVLGQAASAGGELNAVITLKSFPQSKLASETLAEKLKVPSAVIRGRALDSLCAHYSLVAKRAVMKYLKEHLGDEEVVDKIYRCFDPQKKGGEEFIRALDDLLAANPDHAQWEKLVSLRDRLSPAGMEAAEAATIEAGKTDATRSSDALKEIDESLTQVIPLFSKLDAVTKSALRAAEQPFLLAIHEQNLPVDRAPTVLEYCKALDLILERFLGQKYLFPKLDTNLHDFQTLWHRVGFGEEYPVSDKVMLALGVKDKITPENFPLHKAKMMCGTFFNGKILQDRFKVFDGLRAWAVIFLFFTRKITLPTGPVGPLLKLSNTNSIPNFDEKCIGVAKRLMLLQDLRNPAAHRQTYTDLASVTNVRNEAVQLLNTILEMML